MRDANAIGLDIGGTKCTVVLGRAESEGIGILDRLAFPTETARGPQHALGRLLASIVDLFERHRITGEQLHGIGVSCGGPLDTGRGLILSPPNLPGWDRVPIVALLQERFGAPVRLQNDANACALAEWRYGAGRGARDMIFCTFGTGFGAGLILNGRLYTGTNDMAGEIGHVRLAPGGPAGYGKRGSVEGFCSGGGIAQLAREYILEQWQRGREVAFCPTPADLANLSAQFVGEAARAGDPLACGILGAVGRKLGQSLAILVDVLNPEVIVIGSIFARQQEMLWPETARILAEEALASNVQVCRVVPAALGERLGDYASLAVALYDGA